ncbi:MAG: hypothetical protein AW08_03484 [Candidatus Accumulibacter adjunctus]|uniref:Uncharacterized protein n=1 Tax=Candidatus Accumulibacter adjunctus TaxID=1454001 RepID=A0A011MR23_9PROT|nr:MAG: hypothetical protein AW08_03484 [Candidatus Accumulibacter adjunctus]
MAQINPTQLKRRLLLDQSEKVMRRRIATSDAPFLGLFGQVFDECPDCGRRWPKRFGAIHLATVTATSWSFRAMPADASR